jgi:hypothetical protein
MRQKDLKILAFLSFLVVLIFFSINLAKGITFVFQAPFADPSQSFAKTDLVGVWETHYAEGFEKLEIKTDNTFRQIYFSNNAENNLFTEGTWRIEEFSDGRKRIHLVGAHYFLAGWGFSLNNGLIPCGDKCDTSITQPPFFYYDPIAGEQITQVGELILNIRMRPDGKLIMMHMWQSSDQGFALFGGNQEVFTKVGN